MCSRPVEALRAAGVGHPVVDVGDPGVIGGDRQLLVALVAVDQVAQEVRAVRDVDLARGEVGLLEADAAGVRFAMKSAVSG